MPKLIGSCHNPLLCRLTIKVTGAPRLRCESAGGDNKSLICPAGHRAAKVAYVRGRYRFRIPLALEKYLEGDERIHLQRSKPIDATVTALPGNDHLCEASLPQDSLR
jgi:hypothetical protein